MVANVTRSGLLALESGESAIPGRAGSPLVVGGVLRRQVVSVYLGSMRSYPYLIVANLVVAKRTRLLTGRHVKSRVEVVCNKKWVGRRRYDVLSSPEQAYDGYLYIYPSCLLLE